MHKVARIKYTEAEPGISCKDWRWPAPSSCR